MTIQNAMNFIKQGLNDHALRKRFNSASCSSEFHEILACEGFVFSPEEFEQGVFQRLAECREEDAAEQVKEFSMWWNLLSSIIEPPGCKTQCTGTSA